MLHVKWKFSETSEHSRGSNNLCFYKNIDVFKIIFVLRYSVRVNVIFTDRYGRVCGLQSESSLTEFHKINNRPCPT